MIIYLSGDIMKEYNNLIKKYLSNSSWRLRDLILYLAGFFDGEGCISNTPHHFKVKEKEYKYFKPSIQIYNTHKKIMEFISAILDFYQIDHGAYFTEKGRWNPVYTIKIRNKEGIKNFIVLVRDFLICKKEQSCLMLQFIEKGNLVNNETLELSRKLSSLNTKGKFWRDKYEIYK